MPDEDLKWLDEEGEGGEGEGGTALAWEGQELEDLGPPGPYAVKLDDWGKRRGEELNKLDEFKHLQASNEDLADLYGMAFEYAPELVKPEQCADPDKHKYIQSLQENDEYLGLHAQTNFDMTASELATHHFTTKYVEYKKVREQEQKKQGKGKGGPPTPQQQLKEDLQCMAIANAAAKAAAQDVQELNDAREAMGCGSGDGPGTQMDPASVKKMFLKIRHDPNLKRITELAGKYRLMARAKQRNKQIHGYDDMVGIVMDNDLGRLLPSELAMLAHPVLRADAMRRFVERQMMTKEYRAIQNVAKGPIMVVIDESGSMQGEKIAHAKAMALAMAWIAQHQRRWCGFMSFADKNRTRKLALPPDKWPAGEIMDWLSKFIGGGTYLPVNSIPEIYKKLGAQKGRTDIIVITDGDTSAIARDELDAFKRWKGEVEAKIIGISIQERATTLKDMSDEFYLVDRLDVNNEAVGKALSI